MSNLINFYKNVLTSVGYTVDDDGFVKVKNGKKSDLIRIGDKFLVLPTKDQIANMTKVEDGEVHTTKVLFNPLKEDVVKGESESLKKIKQAIEVRLSFSVATLFELLLKLGDSVDLQKKASLDVNTFIGTLKAARGQNVKTVIDSGSLDRWRKIYEQCMKPTSSKGLLHVFVKKGGVINDVKYNRLASMGFPLYKTLLEGGKDIYGVQMRGKDVKVLRLIYEYIFSNIETPEYYMIGSTDTNSPGFLSLFKLYLNVANRVNEVLNNLEFMNEEISDYAKLDLCVDVSELDNTGKFSGELAVIPTDAEANRSTNRLLGTQQAATVNSVTPVETTSTKIDPKALLNGAYNQPQMTAPVPNLPVAAPVMDTTGLTAAQKILYGSNPAALNPQQPGVARPMGINNMQLPQMAAPVYPPQPTYPPMNYPQSPGVYPYMGGNPQQAMYPVQPNSYNQQPRPMGINSMGTYR